jgi:hypothetical protein
MEQPIVITASDLDHFADSRDSQAVIPYIIYLLVNSSVKELTECRIPYGDAINQPGWDGLVSAGNGYRQFVPGGDSYWEIGVGASPRTKATEDLEKRTPEMPPERRSEATYVFVTPRHWAEPSQREWKEQNSHRGWKELRILDNVRLADWIREAPAIARVLQRSMGATQVIPGFSTPAEHWETLRHLTGSGEPQLPTDLFLVGRDAGVIELHRLFKGEIDHLWFAAESPNDTEDFIAAFLQSLDPPTRALYSTRCIFVKTREMWHGLASMSLPHVLIAHPEVALDAEEQEQLHLLARKNRHRIIMPFQARLAAGASSAVPLRSPSRSAIEVVLTQAKFPPERVRELAGAGALSLAALKRHLRGLGEIPPYASWSTARQLGQAEMLGMWDGKNPNDIAQIESFLGKPYGEWIETIRDDALRHDTPLNQVNEKWRIVPRAEAWTALGPRITDQDLHRFELIAKAVLRDVDKKFDLPASSHFTSQLSGPSLTYSAQLREGLAETLALLGSRPGSLSNCSPNRAEHTAAIVVREVLLNASWKVWASLNDLLPSLAEASPEQFLGAVEKALSRPEESVFREVFKQEGDGYWTSNYATGLLWALEALAWSPEYLPRVTVVLGDLASIDPGGRWANRPAGSLTDIFLPWRRHTCADFSIRRAAITGLLREAPDVAWKLLMTLLPSGRTTTSGTYMPRWRNFAPREWNPKIAQSEYVDEVRAYADLAVTIASSDIGKITDLIDRLPDLPPEARSRVLDHLSSDRVRQLSETERRPIWDALVDLATKHRKYANAAWAMAEDAVESIERAAASLQPKAPEIAYQRLFSERDFDLYEDRHDFEKQRNKLDQRRISAVEVILKATGLLGVLQFASQVDSPAKVGGALGAMSPPDGAIDDALLPSGLHATEPWMLRLIGAFVWSRHSAAGWAWSDPQMRKRNWTVEDKVAYLVLLPFLPETWARAVEVLGAEEGRYWRRVMPNPWGLDENALLHACEKLVKYGRSRPAIECLYLIAHHKSKIPCDLGINALLGAQEGEATEPFPSPDYVRDVIANLQLHCDDPSRLAQVEWAYLPLLDTQLGSDVAPRTLEQQLASSPSFFCEAISAIYRADNEPDRSADVTQRQKAAADNAYRLLRVWKTVPGTQPDGKFDPAAFTDWVREMRRCAGGAHRIQPAMSQLGQILIHSPADPDGLWIHHVVAEELNARDADAARSGFVAALYNTRGVYSPSEGAEERALARG